MKKLMLLSFAALFMVVGTACDALDDQLNPERGSLQIVLGGLPADPDIDAGVLIRGPNSSEEEISFGTTLTNLTPGDYTVVAPNVETDDATYAPDAPSTQVEVEADKKKVVTITYSETSN